MDWTTLAWIGLDSGTCVLGGAPGLAAIGALPLDFLPTGPHEARLVTEGELQLAVCGTGADIDMPVEAVCIDGIGTAARLCFTNDVDTVDGEWIDVGTVVLDGSCVAGDPRCAGDGYRFVF